MEERMNLGIREEMDQIFSEREKLYQERDEAYEYHYRMLLGREESLEKAQEQLVHDNEAYKARMEELVRREKALAEGEEGLQDAKRSFEENRMMAESQAREERLQMEIEKVNIQNERLRLQKERLELRSRKTLMEINQQPAIWGDPSTFSGQPASSPDNLVDHIALYNEVKDLRKKLQTEKEQKALLEKEKKELFEKLIAVSPQSSSYEKENEEKNESDSSLEEMVHHEIDPLDPEQDSEGEEDNGDLFSKEQVRNLITYLETQYGYGAVSSLENMGRTNQITVMKDDFTADIVLNEKPSVVLHYPVRGSSDIKKPPEELKDAIGEKAWYDEEKKEIVVTTSLFSGIQPEHIYALIDGMLVMDVAMILGGEGGA